MLVLSMFYTIFVPMSNAFIPDASQELVLNLIEGFHLVLAPPGCGKTQILAERLKKACEAGVPFSEMLCLTFTNRAARSMQERALPMLSQTDEAPFMGNVHRFCSHFLFEKGLISAATSVVSDDDLLSILCGFTGEDENAVAANPRRKSMYMEVMFLEHLLFQIETKQPKALRLHPDCLNREDIMALSVLCKAAQQEFTPATLLDIYAHTDVYSEYTFDAGTQVLVGRLLQKMRLAWQYRRYKKENLLIDFEDILLLAYENRDLLPRYSWIQVDEVQDLNPLQLAIIDALTADDGTGKPCVLYLGDPQQSIFSFMGAKLSTLEFLRQRCAGQVHTLSYNHRSPKYLLDVFNAYATQQLHISPELLPTTQFNPPTTGDELLCMPSTTFDEAYRDVAQQAATWLQRFPQERTAIIVNANADANEVSRALHEMGVPHFKISGDDLFNQPAMKLLFAHLTVMNDALNFLAWARIVQGTQVFQTPTSARNFVQACGQRALLLPDLLRNDDTTYVQRFVHAYENGVITIFDTETTGLDILHDDIVQIAAVQIKQGEIVPGSQFCVYIETHRTIPEMLGDVVNPMIEARRHQPLVAREKALQMFMDYAQGTTLLGHNADYDVHILTANLQRDLPHYTDLSLLDNYFDTLLLAKLLRPGLRQYKLKHLLEVLHLAGENSHLADADVAATRELTRYCYRKALDIVPQQQLFLAQERVMARRRTLRNNYQPLWEHTQAQLWLQGKAAVTLSQALREAYELCLQMELFQPVEYFQTVMRYVEQGLQKEDEQQPLAVQLSTHCMELNTLKETDLCSKGVVDEPVFVTTLHKAKGLEFENVLVFDVVEGRYPNYYHQHDPAQVAEDARKFYVAITRTRKRLIIHHRTVRIDSRGQRHEIAPSRFIVPLAPWLHFLPLPPETPTESSPL